jgi:Oxidoreductase molybdopterin binding domain
MALSAKFFAILTCHLHAALLESRHLVDIVLARGRRSSLPRSEPGVRFTVENDSATTHPQTILAYGLNGRDLPTGNGAPLRLRVERQCGYKNLKFLKSIRVVDSMAGIGKGTGGINSDVGFHWFAGV